MQKNLVRVLAIAVVVLLGLTPLCVYADLYAPGREAGLTIWAVDEYGNNSYAQRQNPGEIDAALQWNIANLGWLEGGATAHDYNELGGWLSFPAISQDWPQTNFSDPNVNYSAKGQARANATDIIQLSGASGTGSFSWEATLTGTMSHLLAEDSNAQFFVRLQDDRYNPTYENQRTLIVDESDCPGGVCNETLYANFTGVPLDVPINIHFGLYVNARLLPDTPAFTIDMADTVTLQLTEILDTNNVPLDLSLFQAESGTNYTGTQVPLPTTILLLGSGLVGLFGIRKKLKK